MAFFYFKPEIIDPFIFIAYNYQEREQQIKLKEITFFETEVDIMNHIKGDNISIDKTKSAKEHAILSHFQNLLNEYFTSGKIELFESLKELDIVLDLKKSFKTEFSKKVLHALINIKPGELISYSELAEKINSKAFRAVGAVLKSNPLPLVIPCHRVIKKNGKIGGFMGKINQEWQIQLKRSLLEIEGNIILE